MLGLAVAGLSGCAAAGPGQGKLFGLPVGNTEQGPHISTLWVGSWIACLAVGAVVWGLMFWAFARYRRRNNSEIPKQTRYNLPMEIMYTVVPFLIIGVLFFYTLQTQDKIFAKTQPTPSTNTVTVVGQKWSWTFNYDNSQVWDAGTIERTPDLYLPVNETTTFELRSPDVIHSFWVPSFYMKMDVVPGRNNSFQVTPNKEGVFAGKCAELCGTYHSAMLFNVHVVPRAEYDRKMAELRDRGQTGENLGSQGANTLAQQAKKEGE